MSKMKEIRQLTNVNGSDDNVLNNELTICKYAIIILCYTTKSTILLITILLLSICLELREATNY